MIDHDRLFKEVLTTFFEEFILLFYPQVYEAVRFDDVRFLSEELYTDVTVGEKYRVDLLVETTLKEEKALILIHIEPQSYVQEQFNERMFIYFSRLYEKYRRPILPIALFTYDTNRAEPNTFHVHLPFADILQFQFLKLELQKENWRNYIRTENPVAAAFLAKMGYTKEERIEVKKEFLRMLVRMEIDQAKQTLLTGFFETYLPLTEDEETQLINEVKQMKGKEGDQIMEVMVSYERRGMEKGIEKGMEKGKLEMARNLLREGVDVAMVVRVSGLSREDVERLVLEIGKES
ncbi:transposase [Halalkalibacter hemicellulosilyticus]|uniref:Transposase (putative) YhgA-like domain-containing protein n=1 Tax=Halalkalibacter hemicellulosilyticusJCM 9152 TaxID=1236971 RepID=W4QIP8_9BACI|nr:transposase [Halalkalibacter hemicellulosilyticus]GAE31792.1 hypothetical protein JCM9152_3282 [Halalkalibacter hemicellulosilyticusJCM 9152]